jgi:hypothetical protein
MTAPEPFCTVRKKHGKRLDELSAGLAEAASRQAQAVILTEAGRAFWRWGGHRRIRRARQGGRHLDQQVRCRANRTARQQGELIEDVRADHGERALGEVQDARVPVDEDHALAEQGEGRRRPPKPRMANSKNSFMRSRLLRDEHDLGLPSERRVGWPDGPRRPASGFGSLSLYLDGVDGLARQQRLLAVLHLHEPVVRLGIPGRAQTEDGQVRRRGPVGQDPVQADVLRRVQFG